MRKWAIWLLGLCWALGAQAAVDCKKQTLDQDEQLHTYLYDYGQDCIKQPLEEQLGTWAIVNTKDAKEQQANLKRMLAAWQDISAALAKVGAGADSSPRMQSVARRMSERATASQEALKKAIEDDYAPDVVVFRRAGWQINRRQMRLAPFDSPRQLPMISLPVELNPDCATPDSALCASTLKTGRAMMLQWRLADTLAAVASQTIIDAVAEQVAAKEALWNKYLYDSKPMLPFDFMFTDWLTGGWSESDQFEKGFRAPPKTQYFVLHPAAAVEYASGAADGEQMKPILYLEVIGANRWNPKDRWIDLPVLDKWSGASLIVSYADRDGIKDTGYGMLFTFDNVYSLGVTRYGAKTGVFLALDLANLWRDKYKPEYEQYKNTFQQLKDAPR